MNKEKNKTREEKIDQAIYESEKEVAEGGKPISLKKARQKLDDESYGTSVNHNK